VKYETVAARRIKGRMMNLRMLMRETFARAVLYSGTAKAIRSILWRDRVAFLLYHDPAPQTLDKHIYYLKTICDIIPISEARTPGSGRPRAVITLDDGHVGNAALLPVFVKHRVRPTIYICSSIVAHSRTHWWKHPAARAAGIERLKRLTNEERLAELRARGFQEAVQVSDTDVSGLSVAHLEAMRPYVDFHSHTRFHPILTRCDDDECTAEVTGSKHEVEQLTRSPCEHFSYTNGNYGPREISAVKAAGYETARTCDVGWNDERTDPFRLKALDIADDASVTWLAAQLTGIPLYLRYVRQGGGWTGRKPQF
jgi:peptidoglycan/xylan/chitin deacetylase (PgdA/CDA1 family)